MLFENRSDYVLHRDDVSFRLLVGLRLRLINSFHKSSAATQLAIAQWHNVVSGELDQISPENERMVPVYVEQLCEEMLAQAKTNLGILVRRPCELFQLDEFYVSALASALTDLLLQCEFCTINLGKEKDHVPSDASATNVDRGPRYHLIYHGQDPQKRAVVVYSLRRYIHCIYPIHCMYPLC
ncbi:hypothetical protein BGZ54_003224 [Gamsiella multidivaricata]|nr:hypothetical protein BGZ54_003224 [Gamsiella multidivaricata]